jgi:hypothetical protein
MYWAARYFSRSKLILRTIVDIFLIAPNLFVHILLGIWEDDSSATIVNVNTYVRAIDKIDDYKMVSFFGFLYTFLVVSIGVIFCSFKEWNFSERKKNY